MSDATDILCQGQFLRLCRRGRWEFVQRHGASGVVGIFALTDRDELVLIEQLRPALGRRVIEIPAGLVGDEEQFRGEALETAARRELYEETGYEAATFERVFDGPSSAGLTDEIITFFIARGLTKVGPGGGDDSEDITVCEVPRAELRRFCEDKIAAGALIDPKVYAAAFLL